MKKSFWVIAVMVLLFEGCAMYEQNVYFDCPPGREFTIADTIQVSVSIGHELIFRSVGPPGCACLPIPYFTPLFGNTFDVLVAGSGDTASMRKAFPGFSVRVFCCDKIIKPGKLNEDFYHHHGYLNYPVSVGWHSYDSLQVVFDKLPDGRQLPPVTFHSITKKEYKWITLPDS